MMPENLWGGEFTIDMTSIKVTDIEDPKWNKKLHDHLRNDDFFAVKKFKTAKLVVKSVKKISDGQYDVKGEITIKDITKPVNFKADVAEVAGAYTLSSKIVVDRTDFGIQYKSGKFFSSLGDKLIYDDFEIKVKLMAK